MAKYTLNTYGWSFEAVCKSLTDEHIQLIKNKMEEEGFTELHEIRFDLDELLDLDFWDGEVFHKTEAFDNGTMHFEVADEEENKVFKFGIVSFKFLYTWSFIKISRGINVPCKSVKDEHTIVTLFKISRTNLVLSSASGMLFIHNIVLFFKS